MVALLNHHRNLIRNFSAVINTMYLSTSQAEIIALACPIPIGSFKISTSLMKRCALILQILSKLTNSPHLFEES